MVWWLSGSVDGQICDFPVNESSVVLMQFLWSVGGGVQATEKSGTPALISDVVYVAFVVWRPNVWLMIAGLR